MNGPRVDFHPFSEWAELRLGQTYLQSLVPKTYLTIRKAHVHRILHPHLPVSYGQSIELSYK